MKNVGMILALALIWILSSAGYGEKVEDSVKVEEKVIVEEKGIPGKERVAKGAFQFDQIYHRYIPEEQFERISEFFDGKENQGSRKIVRSTPEIRSGFYYILRIKPNWNSLKEGSLLRIHYIPAEERESVVQDFALNGDLRKWKGEIFFGLTGDQWVKKGGEPIAWKLELISEKGTVLVEKRSFLWKDPHPSKQK